LKKGDIGGFALARIGKIPPTPLYKGGNIIYGQVLSRSIKNGDSPSKLNSTGAKIFPINACGCPHLLGKKAFLIMLKEFTASDF
jgi:hypothetical protein